MEQPAYKKNKDKYVLCMFQMARSHKIDSRAYYAIMRDIKATADDYALISIPFTDAEMVKQRAWYRTAKQGAAK